MTKHLPPLEGQIFGKLTVEALVAKGRKGEKMYQCRCDCGAIKNIRASRLRRGEAKSCGCSHKKLLQAISEGKIILNPVKIKIGDRFGTLTVEARLSQKERNLIVWQCRCDCGEIVNRTNEHLRLRKHPPTCRSEQHKIGIVYPEMPNPTPKEVFNIVQTYLRLTDRFPENPNYRDKAIDILIRHAWIISYRRSIGQPIAHEANYIRKCLRWRFVMTKRQRKLFKLKADMQVKIDVITLGGQMTEEALHEARSSQAIAPITTKKIKFMRK